jgi:hypothetical protein
LNYSSDDALVHGGVCFNLFGKTIFNLSIPYVTNVLMEVSGSPIYVNLLSTTDKNLDILIPNGIIFGCMFLIFIKYMKENRMVFKKINPSFIKEFKREVKHV